MLGFVILREIDMGELAMKEIDHHVDVEDLERYSIGTSSLAESTQIEEHLLICECCQGRLRETDDYLRAVEMASRQLRRDEEIAERRGWRFPAWFPPLVAVACGLLLVVAALRLVRPPGPVVAVSLSAQRSDGGGTGAAAGQQLMLHPDLTGLAESSSYRLEIVDQTGRAVRQGMIGRAQAGVAIPGLGAGQYFVRLYLPAGELLREYGLQINK
jgi:hypothetical protein